jgi:hypothetical protein
VDTDRPTLEEHFDLWARDEASKMKHKSSGEGEDFIKRRFKPLRLEKDSMVIRDAETHEEHVIRIFVNDLTAKRQ